MLNMQDLCIRRMAIIFECKLAREMANIEVTFKILEHSQPTPVGWNIVLGHLVQDIKRGFTRKARWVKDRHMAADPLGSNYASVISRESARIAFTYATLNDLNVWATDIQNTHI